MDDKICQAIDNGFEMEIFSELFEHLEKLGKNLDVSFSSLRDEIGVLSESLEEMEKRLSDKMDTLLLT